MKIFRISRCQLIVRNDVIKFQTFNGGKEALQHDDTHMFFVQTYARQYYSDAFICIIFNTETLTFIPATRRGMQSRSDAGKKFKNQFPSSPCIRVYYPIKIRSVNSLRRCDAHRWDSLKQEFLVHPRETSTILVDRQPRCLSFFPMLKLLCREHRPMILYIYSDRRSSNFYMFAVSKAAEGMPFISCGRITRERSPRFMGHNVSH